MTDEDLHAARNDPELFETLRITTTAQRAPNGWLYVWSRVEGINLGIVGVMLMIVGAVALALSMLFWSSFSPSSRQEAEPSAG